MSDERVLTVEDLKAARALLDYVSGAGAPYHEPRHLAELIRKVGGAADTVGGWEALARSIEHIAELSGR